MSGCEMGLGKERKMLMAGSQIFVNVQRKNPCATLPQCTVEPVIDDQDFDAMKICLGLGIYQHGHTSLFLTGHSELP